MRTTTLWLMAALLAATGLAHAQAPACGTVATGNNGPAAARCATGAKACVILTWSAVNATDPPTGLRVYRCTNGGAWQAFTSPTAQPVAGVILCGYAIPATATGCENDNIAVGENYSYYVVPVFAGGTLGTPSNTWTSGPIPAPPAPPTNTAATLTGTTEPL